MPERPMNDERPKQGLASAANQRARYDLATIWRCPIVPHPRQPRMDKEYPVHPVGRCGSPEVGPRRGKRRLRRLCDPCGIQASVFILQRSLADTPDCRRRRPCNQQR